MEERLLNDEHEYPSEDVLARCLGKAKPVWDAFTARLATDFSDATLEWHYYKDGKSWLGKLVRKKKTVCWISIWDQFFKTTFYLTAKSNQDIERLPISRALKTAYRADTPSGKLKPITIEARAPKALDDVFTLVKFKTGSK
jgi:hypothetical protein